MARTVAMKIYTFKELLEAEKQNEVSSTAVERARQYLIQNGLGDHWHEQEWEDPWYLALEQIGFGDPDLKFSGFACQGDGASFTSDFDLQAMLKFIGRKTKPKQRIEPSKETGEENDFRPWLANKLGAHMVYRPEYRKLSKYADQISAHVERSSRENYVHEGTCDFVLDVTGDVPEEIEKLFDKFQEEVEELREILCHKIYDDLRELYFSLCEDENLLEVAEEGDFEFFDNGEPHK